MPGGVVSIDALPVGGGPIEIIADGRTVWINGPDGSCLGRFGALGVDVHRSATDLLAGKSQCLVCTHRRATKADWQMFVDAMHVHHAVVVDARYQPTFLRHGGRGERSQVDRGVAE